MEGRRQWLPLICPVLLLGLTACKSADIALVDIGTGNVIHPMHKRSGQAVFSFDDRSKQFTTVVEDRRRLALRTFGYDGRELAKRQMPFFAPFDDSATCALSPEGDRVAYLSKPAGALRLYDVAAAKDTEVWPKVNGTIELLKWLSDSELLLVLRDEPLTQGDVILAWGGEILTLNLDTRAKRTVAQLDYVGFCEDYALSPDRCFLAYIDAKEKGTPETRIIVLDLRRGSTVATLGEDGKFSCLPCWAPDGKSVGYVEGDDVRLHSLESKSSRIIRTLVGRDSTCRGLALSDRYAVLTTGDGLARNSLEIVDLTAGTLIKRIEIDVTGSVFLVDGGKRILCEIY